MTDAQIRFHQLVETQKHNREQEANWKSTLEESIRHNQEQERLSKYSTDTSAAASRYVGEQRAGASMYSADVSAGASKYKTDKETQLSRDQLNWRKYTDTFTNTLSGFNYRLEKAKTESNVDYQKQQISKLQADMENALTQLEQNARQLDLNDVRVAAQNALDRAKSWEAYSKTAMNAQQVIRTIANDIHQIMENRLLRKVKDAAKILEDRNKDVPEDFFGNEDPTWARPKSTGGAD